MGGTLSVTITATMSRSEQSESTSMATPRVLDDVASVVLIDGRHRLHVLRDLQKAKDVVRI